MASPPGRKLPRGIEFFRPTSALGRAVSAKPEDRRTSQERQRNNYTIPSNRSVSRASPTNRGPMSPALSRYGPSLDGTPQLKTYNRD